MTLCANSQPSQNTHIYNVLKTYSHPGELRFCSFWAQSPRSEPESVEKSISEGTLERRWIPSGFEVANRGDPSGEEGTNMHQGSLAVSEGGLVDLGLCLLSGPVACGLPGLACGNSSQSLGYRIQATKTP